MTALKYRLFKKKDPNSQLDLKITLNEVDTREFVLTTDLGLFNCDFVFKVLIVLK